MSTNHTDNAMHIDTIADKLADAEIPGFIPTFTEEEAEEAGAFGEDALSEESAIASSYDSPELTAEYLAGKLV
jgi:hypothetical protein